ncbi:MAG: UDP-N-acetylmuramate-L-alanine ligase [Parcubacteria group bacterium GW2011_GWA2_47_16]|nr:MAG: UDP-N-acetylmuramate-L-alanine ligase [Parcubacteria group bacterium GW2011_GWA2_47_16]
MGNFFINYINPGNTKLLHLYATVLTFSSIVLSIFLFFLSNRVQDLYGTQTILAFTEEKFIEKNDIVEVYINFGVKPPADLAKQASIYLIDLGRLYDIGDLQIAGTYEDYDKQRQKYGAKLIESSNQNIKNLTHQLGNILFWLYFLFVLTIFLQLLNAYYNVRLSILNYSRKIWSKNMVDFSKIKTVHFIGIGGIGTSAIARMFVLEGKSVSGSDMAESEVTEGLREAGARIIIGQDIKDVPKDTDLIVYTIALTELEPELLEELKKLNIPMLSYSEALGVISKDKYTIAITGTHGKTTTTAMVAKILMDAGLDPTVILGSLLLPSAEQTQNERGNTQKQSRTNFVAGKSKYLVVEGCEYRRSFLNLSPKILVVTNIDADHLDYYKDMADIQNAFCELSAKLPKDGFLLVNSHAPNLDTLVRCSKSNNGDWGALVLPEGFKLKIPGKHNLANARAALAVAKALGIGEAIALKSLSEFNGTWRRFEYRGKASNGAIVYDDYGHHPQEIEATLQGAREMFPTQKIVVVFQPHLYSRTKDHLAGFGKCFKLASEVIMLPIYPAREVDPGDISSQMVADEIKKNNQPAYFVNTFAEAAQKAEELAGSDGVIMTMGAGETNRVADILVNR